MKVFKYTKSLDKKEFINYPRKDMGEIEGLDSDIKFYLVIDDNKPKYDSDLEELKYSEEFVEEMHPKYPAIHLARGRWSITEKELIPLEEIKNNLLQELKELKVELSGVISACKNKYDPFRENVNAIPTEFKSLVNMMLQVNIRVENDINNFMDVKLAIKYKIRTPEAEQFINELNKFL